MHGYIGVKFLLNHGAFLSVAMSESLAKQTINNLQYAKALGHISSNDCPPPPGHTTQWSLLWSTVQAVHTFALEQPTGGSQYVSGVPIR